MKANMRIWVSLLLAMCLILSPVGTLSFAVANDTTIAQQDGDGQQDGGQQDDGQQDGGQQDDGQQDDGQQDDGQQDDGQQDDGQQDDGQQGDGQQDDGQQDDGQQGDGQQDDGQQGDGQQDDGQQGDGMLNQLSLDTLSTCDKTAKCPADDGQHDPGCNKNGECIVTVKVTYYTRINTNSGGSHYINAEGKRVEDTEIKPTTYEWICKVGESNTYELPLADTAYVIESIFGSGTNATLKQDMVGNATLSVQPEGNGFISFKAGLDWTARVSIYNYVLVNGSYKSQFVSPTNANTAYTASSVLLPKDKSADEAFVTTDSRETAYTGFAPSISQNGEYANYKWNGLCKVTYNEGVTSSQGPTSTVVFSNENGTVDNLAQYGLKFDPVTGAISALDEANSPVLSGNQLFTVTYYFAKPDETVNGLLYVYNFIEDANGPYNHDGKKYSITKDTDIRTLPSGQTETVQPKEIPGYAFVDADLHLYTSSWVLQADGTYGFKCDEKGSSVIIQPNRILGIYNYYDAGVAVTVNRSYYSGYSATPTFTGTPDYSEPEKLSVPLSKEVFTPDMTSKHAGYTLSKDSTTVTEGYEFTKTDDGTVTVILMPSDNGLNINLYYYRQLTSGGGDPDPDPTPTPVTHTVSVRYVNENGVSIHSPYSVSVRNSASYDVSAQTAIEIEGYSIDRVEGTVSGTATADVDIVVHYASDATITDPDTPLGERPDGTTGGNSGNGGNGGTEGGDDIVIIDPDVPLGKLPNTGATAAAPSLFTLLLMLTAGVAIFFTGRKEEQ